MTRIRVAVDIDAPVAVVWRHLRDIASHVEWMADAEEIRFVGAQRRGVGTRFECATRIGPFSTLDIMEVVEWRRHRVIGVRHEGVVTGTGRFVLKRRGPGRTRLVWQERLTIPWWMGGAVGGVFAAEVLRLVWRRNLRGLRSKIQARSGRRSR